MNQLNSHNRQRTYIIGGGIVGASLALKLAQNKHPVTLIDARNKLSEQQWQSRLAKRDARVYALSLATIELLKDIGVWQRIEHTARKADYYQMQVWQTNGVGELKFGEFSFDESNLDKLSFDELKRSDDTSSEKSQLLGSMVEPSVIEYALYQQLNQLMADDDFADYLSIIQGHKVTELEWINDNTGYQITLDGDDECSDGESKKQPNNLSNKRLAKLVIGADGRGSSVRRLAGIGLDTLDYQQTAICCAIKTEKPHLATARQAMLPTGTLALLPMAEMAEIADINDTGDSQQESQPHLQQDSQRWQSVVWTLPTNQAIDLLTLDDKSIADKLAFASGYELGNIEKIESIASFPLTAQQAKSYIKKNLALVGDSAHGVHPLAGQGLNLGMLDVIELANLLMTDYQRSHGSEWGHWQTLNRYQRRRRAKNSMMMHSFSMINWLFAGQFAQLPPIVQARSEGMALVGENKRLMKWFRKQASGQA